MNRGRGGGHERPLVIGSRRSRLARRQAEWVGRRLAAAWPELEISYVGLSTAGDRRSGAPISRIEGRGVFTAELERALLEGEVDLAVHSLKDLPTAEAPGAAVVAVPEREDPADVLVTAAAEEEGDPFDALPAGAVVATSSVRRAAQARALRPDLRVRPIRGNVDTRLLRLEEGAVDALILAAAGLRRLGVWPEGARRLEPSRWLPAPGQGALGVQGRTGDDRSGRLAEALEDRASRAAVTAERALLGALHGGCEIPLGALARVDGEELSLEAAVYDPAGEEAPVRGSRGGSVVEAAAVGAALAEELSGRGAGALIARAREEGAGR